MGGELLASQDEEPSPLATFTEIFNDVFPYYLHIGMSEAQFWDGDCELAKFYRKAHDLKRQEVNEQLWLQGLYIYEAIANLSPALRAFTKNPKPAPYPKKPYPLDTKEIREEKKREQSEAQVAQHNKLMAWAKAVNAKKREQDG